MGGDADRNRQVAEGVLEGKKGAPRDIVVMNAALALMSAGRALGYDDGARLAAQSIDSGAARWKLVQLRAAMAK